MASLRLLPEVYQRTRELIIVERKTDTAKEGSPRRPDVRAADAPRYGERARPVRLEQIVAALAPVPNSGQGDTREAGTE